MTQPQPETTSVPEVASDLWNLLVAYLKQETVDPLRSLGNFFKFGVAGAVLVATGTVLLSLSVLRVLQTETGTALTGNLSWIPYLVTLVFTAVVIALSVSRVRTSRRS